MLKTALSAQNIQQAAGQSHTTAKPKTQRAVFRMAENERMAGSMPVWEAPKSAKDDVLSTLADAGQTQNQNPSGQALTYADPHHRTPPQTSFGKPFGFGDLVDMANPLQHIPVVNQIYRGVTGDEISPASKLVGGSLYGGLFGGAVALADIIVTHEHGTDVPGLIKHIATGAALPKRHHNPSIPDPASFHSASPLAAQEIASRSPQEDKRPSYYSFEQDERTAGFKRFTGDRHRTDHAAHIDTKTIEKGFSAAEPQIKAPWGTHAERGEDKDPITRLSLSAMPPENPVF